MTIFNLKSYQNTLQIIQKNYHIQNFSDTFQGMIGLSAPSKVCCLRHDIDYSLEQGLTMAVLENKLGIAASYFILVDCDFYNIFSKNSSRIIKEISDLGHEIGVHFDVGLYEVSEREEVLHFHAKCLEQIVEKEIGAVSYHCPGVVGLQNLSLESEYFGYKNTYSKDFNKHFSYVSDSLCDFRDKGFWENITKGIYENIHLLLHPIWWCTKGHNAIAKIKNFLQHKTNDGMHYFNEILKTYEK